MSSTSSILVVDVGNTSIKLGEFAWPAVGGSPAPRRTFRLISSAPDWIGLDNWLEEEPDEIFLVSVCPPAAELLSAWLVRRFGRIPVRQLQTRDFPLQVRVEFPERVGHDRLAAAVAVGELKTPGRAAIVVDAGSAVTVDLVSPDGDFLGGAIFPGWQTMAGSLATATHFLPRVEPWAASSAPPVVGRTTEQAISSGLYWGSVGAVRELVERMSAAWQPAPERILGGGDTDMLVPHLGPNVRSVPDIVLRGILRTAALLGPVANRDNDAEPGSNPP